MRVLTKLSTALLLFAALFVFTPDARADEAVIITGGSAISGNHSGGSFTLIGQNFSLSGGFNYGPGFLAAPSGSTITFRVFNLGLDLRGGPGVVNEISYNSISYLGHLSLSTTVVFPLDGSQTAILTAPFSLSGHLRACPSPNVEFQGCPPGFVFDSQVLGQGIATIELHSFIHHDGTRHYGLTSIRYDIQAPAQTPEPATILLLGTALTALGASARRRRRARREE